MTVAFVGALSVSEKSGFLGSDMQDVLVGLPGVFGLGLADRLRIVSQLPDAQRCDPRAWSKRHRTGERRRVNWAGFPADGRLLLQVEIQVDGGVFPNRKEQALLALRPDGALDESFAAQLHGPVGGRVMLVGERLVVIRGGQIETIYSNDGTGRPVEERNRLAAALDAFGGRDAVLGGDPGVIVVFRGTAKEQVAVFDLSGVEARLVGSGNFFSPSGVSLNGALADGDAALMAGDQLQRHRPDGTLDPAFRFRVLSRSATGADATPDLRKLVRVGGQPLLLFRQSDRDYLAVVARDGTVDRDAAVVLSKHQGEERLWVDTLVPLDDGHFVVAFDLEHKNTDAGLAVLRPGSPAELGAKAFDFPVGESRTTELGTLFRLAGEVVALGRRGEVLLREGSGQLVLHDLAAGGRRRLAAPAWIESDD